MLEAISERYDQIVEIGLQYHQLKPPLVSKSGKKRRFGHNLVMRFRDFKDGILMCLHNIDVPYSNNLAERDLRMMKLRQKISGGFRNSVHAEAFCRIRSYIGTLRKRSLDIFTALRQIFVNQNQVSI